MDRKNITARAAAAVALALVAAAPTMAQSPQLNVAPTLSFTRPASRDSGHMLLLISAVVMVIGIVDDDSTLAILGGAGVVFSLYEEGDLRYRPQSSLRGMDLMKVGSLSFGVSPKSQMSYGQAFADSRPTPYLQVTSKF